MNWLKQKIKDSLPLQKIIENQQFFRILAVAIAVNLGLAGIYVVLQDSVKDITVTVNGKTAQYKTIRNSVSKLLRGWEVELDEKDRVVPGVDAELEDGMNVKIETYRVARETVEEETSFKTKKSYTSDLIEGETKVAKKGSKGLDKVVYEVAYLGDKEQSRKVIERTT
ncbi:MAG: G5 domain-containing protein, partial [Firmicutes bacterium]|nr:G5 domain-containing protein [Bacillota bacterium]